MFYTNEENIEYDYDYYYYYLTRYENKKIMRIICTNISLFFISKSNFFRKILRKKIYFSEGHNS